MTILFGILLPALTVLGVWLVGAITNRNRPETCVYPHCSTHGDCIHTCTRGR